MSSSNTDFDATLVDWLYGELDPDATASFEAHLDAHPEHKAEAHALRDTRVAFRGLPEAEPSNALTAMLMQQAAAAAQPKQGLWAAMVGFFQPVLLHPAASAMATVVLLVGVAGALYLRNGNMVADTTVASSEPPAAAQPMSASTPELGELETRARGGEMPKDMDESRPQAPAMEQGFAADIASREQEESLRAAREEVATQGLQKEKRDYQEFADAPTDDGEQGYALDDLVSSNAISGGALSQGNKALNRDTSFSKAPISDEAPKRARKEAFAESKRRARTVAKPEASKNKKMSPNQQAIGWEDEQVQNFQSAARSKRCRDAGRIANDIRDKSRLAYDRNVKGTREESDCSYYIASETKRRKAARAKRVLSKKKARRKGQGRSVPKKAVAAPAEDSFDDEPAEATANGL